MEDYYQNKLELEHTWRSTMASHSKILNQCSTDALTSAFTHVEPCNIYNLQRLYLALSFGSSVPQYCDLNRNAIVYENTLDRS